MNRTVNGFLWFLLISILCIATLVGVSTNRPIHSEIGPHQPQTWNSGWYGEFSGEYHLESTTYFEVTQKGQPPIQAKYQQPDLGQEDGKYALDLKLNGTYQVTHSVTIYSLETGTVSFTVTTGEAIANVVISILVGCLIFLVILLIIAFAM